VSWTSCCRGGALREASCGLLDLPEPEYDAYWASPSEEPTSEVGECEYNSSLCCCCWPLRCCSIICRRSLPAAFRLEEVRLTRVSKGDSESLISTAGEYAEGAVDKAMASGPCRCTERWSGWSLGEYDENAVAIRPAVVGGSRRKTKPKKSTLQLVLLEIDGCR